ncbi:MAG: hypothetical protein MRZ90_07245 [Candidatus Gastranaerophilales bacterium]|mgnify:FL=1|nr:hypothetical protein [Candidatus Gastranaerophilales bacterium]
MAQIIETMNEFGVTQKRRLIKMSAADVISIVQEYQNLKLHNKSYEFIKNKLNEINLFVVEDI